MTIIWTCPTCNHDTEVEVDVSGGYPTFRDFIDPAFCSNCDEPIEPGTALEQAREEAQDHL